MDCRGTEKRQWIVDNYNVTPVAHMQLLAGQTKHSDAGQIIENDYYIFEAINKTDKTKKMIQCGMGASKDFLRLLNHEGLPIFNPLCGAENNVGQDGGNVRNGGKGKTTGVQWNPVAKQLYNACMWVITIINANPDTPIFDIMRKVNTFKYKEPFASQVRGVNTIIRKNLSNKTLTEVINELRAFNDIRDNMCQFDMLTDVIVNYKDKEGNHIDIEPLF